MTGLCKAKMIVHIDMSSVTKDMLLFLSSTPLILGNILMAEVHGLKDMKYYMRVLHVEIHYSKTYDKSEGVSLSESE